MSFLSSAPATLNPWVRVLGALQKKVNRQAYERWFKPTIFSHLEDRVIVVRVPRAEFLPVGERYADLITEALDTLALPFDEVRFVALDDEPAPARMREDGGFPPASTHGSTAVPTTAAAEPDRTGARAGQRATPPQQGRFDWGTAAQLNPRYTFDGFITGTGNQFARAAASAVAERPFKAYNPLFLYGPVGMGKTHLMQAIGHELKRRVPITMLCYVSGERFTNEMINALHKNTIQDFRDRYRSVDLLLIDDIQFIAGKERTQEEFFHTFNSLHEYSKQIVIASDRQPKEIKDLEDRLRSRFEQGLIVDIQPPDLETRVAILQKKAESEQVKLPVEVALFIASNIRTNVRELEGALTRLLAWCSLHGVEITMPVTQQCLKQFIDTQVRKVTIETIQRVVAEHFGMKVNDLKQKNNSRAVVVPRQIAMFLAKQMTEASLPEIGRQFGNKHHTTVMHSIAKIEEQRRADKDLNRTLSTMQESLNA